MSLHLFRATEACKLSGVRFKVCCFQMLMCAEDHVGTLAGEAPDPARCWPAPSCSDSARCWSRPAQIRPSQVQIWPNPEVGPNPVELGPHPAQNWTSPAHFDPNTAQGGRGRRARRHNTCGNARVGCHVAARVEFVRAARARASRDRVLMRFDLPEDQGAIRSGCQGGARGAGECSRVVHPTVRVHHPPP